jgi:hypothetical protein
MDRTVGYNKELYVPAVIKLPSALEEINQLRRGFSVVVLLPEHLTSGKSERKVFKIVALP